MAKKTENKKEEVKNTITRENWLNICILHEKMKVADKDMKLKELQLKNVELTRKLLMSERLESTNSVLSVQGEYKQLLKDIKTETGVDVDNKTINPDTLEVTN